MDYLDIAEAVRDVSGSPRADLNELFNRAVAAVAIGDTDDHLRNHGFLASGSAWSFSPAFDIDPVPDIARRRATSIAGAGSFPDEVEGLFALADECSVPIQSAKDAMGRIAAAMLDWKTVAARNGVPAREMRMMAGSIEPRIEAVSCAASS